MNAMTDFEELIDLNIYLLSVSQRSSPISDILDKICDDIDESNLLMGNILKSYKPKVPNENVAGLEEFERILATKCLGDETKEENIDCLKACNEQHVKNDTDEILANESIIDLDEFESFIENDSIEYNTNENREVKNENDLIDLNELNSQNLYLDYDSIGAENNNYTTSSQLKYVGKLISPYEVPVELEADYKCKLETVTEHTQTNEIYEEKNPTLDSDDGYTSSDFEFITEEEASKAGIITKIGITTNENNINIQNSNDILNSSSAVPISTSEISNDKNGLSNSCKYEVKPSDYIKYSKHRYQRCFSRQSSEFHVTPTGEQYLDMFRGEYSPMVINNLHTMRSKRVLPAVPMAATADIDSTIFRSPKNDEEYEKYKDDADECLKTILASYPGQNRRKRRRHV